jgi:hypothetical protein
MDYILTFNKNGNPSICRVNPIDNDPIGLLHKSDVREQMAEWARKNIKLDDSDISLGYVLETMPKFCSRITDAVVRSGKMWEEKLYQSATKR